MHFIKKAEKRNKERSKMHRWLKSSFPCSVPPVAIVTLFWFAGSSGGKTGSLLAYVSAWYYKITIAPIKDLLQSMICTFLCRSLVFMDTPYLRYSKSVSWMTLTCLKRLTEQKRISNRFVLKCEEMPSTPVNILTLKHANTSPM